MSKSTNRYLVLLLGAIVNFSYGSAYIWTVFQPAALEKFSLSAASANAPFAIFMGVFVLGNILGGKLQQLIPPQRVVLGGSFLMCAGFWLTGLVPIEMPGLLYVSYGIMGGTGAGIAYNALVATVQKWFPDKRGMVTGIIICTVGAPGLIMTPICNQLIAVFGFSTAIMIVSGIYGVICFGGGWMIKNPPEGYMADYQSATTSRGLSKTNYTTIEMVKTLDYYLVAGSMMVAVIAYFLINPMMKSLGVERGLTETVAIGGVMLSSVLNVAGRLTIPWVSDKLGRMRMIAVLFLVSMTAVVCLIFAQGYLFMICVALISYSYGGFFGMFPVVTADYFGAKYSGMNYGVVMIGYGIMSILCPILTKLGVNFSFAFAGGACIVGIILVILLQKRAK